MRLKLAVSLVAALTVAACSESTPTAPTLPVSTPTPVIRISGRVLDYRSGAALGGTPITWRPIGTGSPQTQVDVITDANGRFEVALPVHDRFSFEIPLDTLNFQGGTVRVPGKRLESDLLINGGPCAARYGYVFDAVTRQPIAGARVVRAGSAITDANGYYRIDIGCEPFGYERWGIGTTTIHVTHPAYQNTSELDGRAENTSYSGVRRIDFALQPLGQ